jgi:uncharacterized membrane protein YdbT with pleckstrin-like domain
MSDAIKWSARPSVRPHILIGAIALLAGAYSFLNVGSGLQSFINGTSGVIFWSDGLILGVYRSLQVLCFIPLLLVVWFAIRQLTSNFEIEDGRLLYHHGLLVRKHDQIALQRVRDFRVYRPFVHMILGVGKVHIVSRDETFPELTIGPFKAPRNVENIIRRAVLDQQEKSGYREVETT